ncbi:unnamed protein product [Effrenium voratum]|uniref:O-methyltransferase n=1 Tax=Effrenium voratum TaxID=2562239 RepID=A0AA36NF78_9DINO|nr:unnamed protein product [Effrenium voratum]
MARAAFLPAAAAAVAVLAWWHSRRRQKKPYTSIEAAEDPEVVGAILPDAYEGTRLATARHAFCVAHSSPLSDAVQQVADRTQKLRMPQMLSSPLTVQLLQSIIRASQATRVLEIGTYTGFTAIGMAEALPPGGTVVCLDDFSDEPDAQTVCEEAIASSAVSGRIQLRVQQALRGLKQLADEGAGPFDICFIDADKENQIAYVELLDDAALLKPGASVLVDNTLWYSRVLRPSDKHDKATAAIAEFNKHVLGGRWHVAMLPIRDGITILQRVAPAP